MEPHVKKILAVVVLIALAYTGFTILNCTLFSKSTKAAQKAKSAVSPVKALTAQFGAALKSQDKTTNELRNMAAMEITDPAYNASKYLGAQGMLMLKDQAATARLRRGAK